MRRFSSQLILVPPKAGLGVAFWISGLAQQRESEKELENLSNSLMQRAFRGESVQ